MATFRPSTLICDGAHPLGAEICRQLTGLGHRVSIGARDVARARALTRASACGARVVPLDPAEPDAARRAIDACGPVDILVVDARAPKPGPPRALLDADLAEAGRTLEAELLGCWRLVSVYAPPMVDAMWGRIVTLSACEETLRAGGGGAPAEAIARFGIAGLTIRLAAELHGTGVLANAVCHEPLDEAATDPLPLERAAALVVWAATLPDNGPSGTILKASRPPTS